MKISWQSWFEVRLLKLIFLVGVMSSWQTVFAATNTPVLLSNATSTRALAFESVTQRPEPFNITAATAFSPDTRTRVEMFAMNLDLLAGEGANAFTADAEDAAHIRYSLSVEYVGPVPSFEGIYMIVLRLDDAMTNGLGDVLVRLNLHGVSSNRVRIAIGNVGGGPADDPGAVPTPAPPTPPSPQTPLTITQYRSQLADPAFAAGPDGVRFLEQVTWGPSSGDLQHLRSIGMQAYLDEQFNATDSNYPLLTLWPPGAPPPTCTGTCVRDNYTMYPLQIRFFQNALTGPDQLRQRVSFALHQLIPVSGRDLNNSPGWVTPYLRILDTNAFGNFKNVLAEITLNPAMGNYLDMAGNSKASPNENYAREIMQLFSIGPDLLNADGKPVLDAQGNRVPSYDNGTITNLARVFTGWQITTTTASFDGTLVPDYITPMSLQNNTNTYDVAAKTLAPVSATTFPACSNCTNATNFKAYKTNELNLAIEALFNHQNTGPYVCTQLIHQLVTSNPSPAYVGRCAAAFANTAGVRGDMKGVITAIILDPEARGDVKTDPKYGHLREPVLFINNQLRAFNATSDYNLAGSLRGSFSYTNDLDQDLFSPPTVFSYYAADYGLPGTTLLGPEFGLLSTSSTLKRTNFVDTLFFSNNGNGIPPGTDRPTGTQANYSSFQAMAGNPQQLVEALDALLLHSTMSDSMKTNIIQTVTNVTNGDAAIRTRTAIYLILSSSQYQVER